MRSLTSFGWRLSKLTVFSFVSFMLERSNVWKYSELAARMFLWQGMAVSPTWMVKSVKVLLLCWSWSWLSRDSVKLSSREKCCMGDDIWNPWEQIWRWFIASWLIMLIGSLIKTRQKMIVTAACTWDCYSNRIWNMKELIL